MLDADSPLRSVPVRLHPRQRLFIDGIRYSIDAVDLAYRRLETAAAEISNDASRFDELRVPLFVDAWTVIDWVHRLHDLVHGMRGMKRSPEVELFLRETKPVNELRNVVQHLRSDECYNNPAPTDVPWGSLNWVFVQSREQLVLYSMVCGAIVPSRHEVSNPLGRRVRSPVDHVMLRCFDKEGPLSEFHRAIAAFVPHLEEKWSSAIKQVDGPTCESDVLTSIGVVSES